MSRKETVDDYAKVIVAKYLKRNGFPETLNAFLRESGQTSKILTNGGDGTQIGGNHGAFEDLETLLGERIEYAEQILSNGIKELTVNDSLPVVDADRYYVPTWNHQVDFREVPFACKRLPTTGLPINVSFCEPEDSLIVSTSSKEVVVYEGNGVHKSFEELSRKFGIIRLCGSVGSTAYHYLCCLDGTLILKNGDSNWAFKLHKRIISHVKFIPRDNNFWLVVSCGLDNYLKLHLLDLTKLILKELSSVKLLSPCTSLQVAREEVSGDPMVFLTRQDFTHVMCYKISQQRLIVCYKIALNNSQFSAFAFNVRDMVILGDTAPDGLHNVSSRSTLAVVTSHIPFMRLLLVEIPTLDSAEISETNAKTFYDKVLRNMATEVSQDPYSQPILAALQHGNGVLVGGNQGLYAIDIEQGDSWLLDVSQILKGQRIKCMQANRSGTKLVLSLSNRAVHLFNLVTKR